MFEHRKQPLLSSREFLIRQLIYLLVAFGIIAGSLAMGMFGYHFFENLSWIDSLVNASMLLGGDGSCERAAHQPRQALRLFLCSLFRHCLPGGRGGHPGTLIPPLPAPFSSRDARILESFPGIGIL